MVRGSRFRLTPVELLVTIAVVGILSTVLVPVFAQTVSEEQAVAAAADVAAALDIPFGEGATATYYESKHRGYSGPEWEIEFYDFSEISVDPLTGKVTGILNHVARREASALVSPESTPIPEAEAIKIATHVLETLGMPEDLVFKEATCEAHVHRADGTDVYEWNVKWDRVYQGIPYERGNAAVSMDAATGRFIAGGISRRPPTPVSVDVRLSKEEAIAIALDFAASRGFELPDPDIIAELRIVQPNDFWSDSGRVKVRWDDPTCVVWFLEMVQMHDIGSSAYRFLVDAADGSMVGGGVAGGGAGGALPPSSPPASTSALPTQRVPLLSAAIATAVVGATAFLVLRGRRSAALKSDTRGGS